MGMAYSTDRRDENIVASEESQECRSVSQQPPWDNCQRHNTTEQLSTDNVENLWLQTSHIRSKRDGITANVDTQNRQTEAEGSKETSSACARSPEAIKDGVEQIPLVPVCLSKPSLYSSSCTNAEEKDQCLACEYGRCLSPAGILGTASVSCQIGLLECKLASEI